MIEFQVDTTGLTRMEKSLAALAGKQFRYATSQALNDCTRAAANNVNAAMPELFDRPTAFTDRAAVAPRSLAATRENLVSTVTLRDIQAKYLLAEEQGGTRTAQTNTRKPASALILPGKGLELNEFGNIPDGTLRNFKADSKRNQKSRRKRLIAAAHRKQGKVQGKVQGPIAAPDDVGAVIFLAAGVPANKAGIGGYFRRLANGHLTRLTAFVPETHYKARLGYHARVQAVISATWLPALLRRFHEALASAR